MGKKEALQPGQARQDGPSLRDELLADPTPPPPPPSSAAASTTALGYCATITVPNRPSKSVSGSTGIA